ALGAGSVASVDKGVAGYDPTTKAASKKTDKVWKSTLAAVSVGNADNTRQITNVAAGFEDTDAVNVAQLKAVDKKVAVVFDDKNSLMSIDAKIKHEILEDPGRFPEGEGQSIALGKDAYAYMQGGRKAQGVLFGMKKATGAIAIGQNAKALSHSIAIGNRLYAGDMGDVKISPSDYNVENGSGVASTLLGNNSYAGGTLSTLVGSYSIMSTSYPGGHQKAYMQNAGAVSVGALNSIESATAKQGTSFFGQLPDDKSSGVANSIVGLANRAYNANGALIYGAGNEITNSIASVTAPAAKGSVKAAAENLRKAIKTNPGGAVLAIGGGNKADLAVRSQLIGVANTLTGTSETPSEYNMLDGFNNTGTNVKHITLMGSENTVSDTTGAILLGDKRKLTGANGSIVLGVADTEKELTVKDAVLIGHNADVQNADGVALGAGSVASVDKDVAGYDPSTGAASTKTGPEWKSTLAAVSVGNADNTRQITNVAAGFEDTDAVNVAQLKAVKTSVTGNATDIAALKGGFTVSNAAGAKQNITLGDATKQNIMFQGEENTIDVDVAHASDGATVTVKANAKLGENIDLSNNNTITTINNNIETLKGGFKVKSDSVTGEIKAGDTLEFAGKNHVETTYDKTLKTLTIGLDDATKNKIDNINTTINAAAKWTIQDSESTPGSKTIDAATPLVVQGADGVTAKVDDAGLHLGIDASKIDLSSNTTVTNITNNLSRGFELRAGTESTGAKIALDGDKRPAIRFDVAATDKGLTVTRDENTVKYGIDGSKIDLTGNTAITNITSNLAQASAWKLQVNGKNERTIGKDNVVNFINGEYTEVTAEGSNKVKIDLNKAAKDKLDTLEGKIKANKVQVTGDAATGVKVAGTQENDGSTTYKVSLGEKIQVGGVTMDGAGDNRTITGLTNTSLDVAGFATSQRAATEEQLQAAMTQMSANAKITTVESGDENIVVNKTEGQNENKYTVALNKNLNVDSLNAGGTQVNKDGISVRGADGKPGVTITKNGIDAGNKKITNVADGVDAHDAATVGQLGKLAEDAGKGLNELGNQISKLDGRVNKVGAGAAALAAMHPLDFDPDDKWNVSAGYGSYKGSHAGAIGAFYRPDENTMFNIGASVGGGENMVNAGVTFALDRKSHITTSRTAMAREIMDLRKEITELKAARANGNWMLDPEMTKLFPDVPENHWAYEYIAKLAGNGIIKGYPDGSFAGNRMMTRYEFAALLYRAMENGANVDARALKEFAPEMGRIRVDRVYGKDNDRNKIERVRVNNENTQERDTYGSKIQIAAK
ncbi:MAG: S-layer homology domain-containing protein, partial [Succiniclasticum sp.]|nr:S-layer homology domain-containing protein [Succiniclasticum sp.]